MAAPTIALRFRDTTPDVDTIAEHRRILERWGGVWWGWWKKKFEDQEDDFLARLNISDSGTTILIVDRSTENMFLATCVQWAPKGDSIDPELVPPYYRNYIPKVAGWFLLTSLESTKYDPDIGDSFGDSTFLRLTEQVATAPAKVAKSAGDMAKSCILHLSDLHFGEDYAFLPQGKAADIGDPRGTLTDRLIEDIDRLGISKDIAAVIVTGDFISKGKWIGNVRESALAEFEALRNALALPQELIIPVPGNHDIVRYPPGAKVNLADLAVDNQTTSEHELEFRFFVELLSGRSRRESLNYVRRVQLKEVDLLVCVLNSCTIVATNWTEYGYVGKSGLDAIEELKAIKSERPTFRFIALHHHLLPVIGVEVPQPKGVSLSLDASELLDAAQKARVHVALHGHQHLPKIARYQSLPLAGLDQSDPLYVVSNGSTGAIQKRLPGDERNTYCAFRLGAEKLELWMRELRPDGRRGGTLYEGILDTRPEPV